MEYLQANRLRQKLIHDMAELMTKIDVYVNTDVDLLSWEQKEARHIMNLTRQPCVVIPHGGSSSLGFTGRVFEEATILALAKAYQDLTPYHTNRPPAFVQ